MSRYSGSSTDYRNFNNEFYNSDGIYILGGARSCNGTNAAIGGAIGGGIFLWGIICLLYGLRLRSLKRIGKLTFSPKSAQGRAEILTALFMVLMIVILLMSFVVLGYAVDNCKELNKAANMVMEDIGTLDDAQILYRSTQEKLDKTLLGLILPGLAFSFLTIWIARAASTFHIAVFHSGLKTITRFVLYFECFVVAFLLILSGIALPAVLKSWGVFEYASMNDFYFTWENHQATVRAFIWVYFIGDFIYLCLAMYLTWNVNSLLRTMNLPWQETRAASQWTLTIISILIPVATIVTYAMGIEYAIIFLAMIYVVEMYFAWVLALLPGFRFWHEAWKLFPQSAIKDVERIGIATAHITDEKAVDPNQAAVQTVPTQAAQETSASAATSPEISEVPNPQASPSAYAASRGL